MNTLAMPRLQPTSGARLTRPAAIALGTLLAAALDLASAFVHWGLRGVAPERVLAAVARWVFETPLPQPWMTSLAGCATLIALYLPAVIALDAWSARRGGGNAATGVAWGVLTYVALFRIVAPIIAHPVVLDASPGWLAVCVLVHGAAIGPAVAGLIGRAQRG